MFIKWKRSEVHNAIKCDKRGNPFVISKLWRDIDVNYLFSLLTFAAPSVASLCWQFFKMVAPLLSTMRNINRLWVVLLLEYRKNAISILKQFVIRNRVWTIFIKKYAIFFTIRRQKWRQGFDWLENLTPFLAMKHRKCCIFMCTLEFLLKIVSKLKFINQERWYSVFFDF